MTSRRARRDIKWKLTKFAFTLCFLALIFSLIWFRTTTVSFEYELAQYSKQRIDLVKEEKMVLAEKANGYSVERIEGVAIKKLGMRLPDREKVYFVKQTTGAAPYKVSTKSVPRD